MDRRDAVVCAVNRALEQAPKVFEAVRMDAILGVALSMNNRGVDVIPIEAVVGLERVRVDRRTGFHLLSDDAL